MTSFFDLLPFTSNFCVLQLRAIEKGKNATAHKRGDSESEKGGDKESERTKEHYWRHSGPPSDIENATYGLEMISVTEGRSGKSFIL